MFVLDLKQAREGSFLNNNTTVISDDGFSSVFVCYFLMPKNVVFFYIWGGVFSKMLNF